MPDQPPRDVLGSLDFPLRGIDTSNEFELQKPGTCADAENVRAVEPGTMRARGGSRPGMSRYINEPLEGAGSL